jgi:hypothetical protein
LHTTVISNFVNGGQLTEEFSKIYISSTCDSNDYTFVCTEGTCTCSGLGCPTSLQSQISLTNINLGITVSTEVTGNGIEAASKSFVSVSSNPLPILTSYYIASFCAGGSRYIYSEATISNQGNKVDFIFSSKRSQSFGGATAAQTSNCGLALLTGSHSTKAACRGDMATQCSDALDKTCKNTGLYDNLVRNPATSNPNPDDCNESLPGYSDNNCFEWIMSNMSFGTIALDTEAMNNLPKIIQSGIDDSRRRNRRNLATVSNNDPSAADSKSQVDGSINEDDMAVDSSTSSKAANPKLYANSLDNESAKTSVSGSMFKVAFYTLILSILAIIF